MTRAFLTSFVAFLFTGSGCASPLSDAQRDQLARAAIRAQETGVCNVHHMHMKKTIVPIHWGLVVMENPYYSAELHDFPNARAYVNGGCEFDPKRDRAKHWRYVCPECKRAEKDWALKHPKDPDAEWILSHT